MFNISAIEKEILRRKDNQFAEATNRTEEFIKGEISGLEIALKIIETHERLRPKLHGEWEQITKRQTLNQWVKE